MVENIVITKLLYDLIPIAMSQLDEPAAEKAFSKSITEIFGIDEARIRRSEEKLTGVDSLDGYVLNTKKAYVDNQLSEYSEFPRLIDYKNAGYSSCAVLPISAPGKSIGVLELLSKTENRFSEEMISTIAIGAAFIGLALNAKAEARMSKSLASYFDSAFSSPGPKLLVNSSGAIIKANKSAIAMFSINQSRQPDISSLGLKMEELSAAPDAKPLRKRIIAGGSQKLFEIYTSKASQNSIHLAFEEITDSERNSGIGAAIALSKSVAAMSLDDNMVVVDGVGSDSSNAQIIDSLKGRSIAEALQPAISEKLISELKSHGRAMLPATLAYNGQNNPVYLSIAKYGLGYICIITSAALEESVRRLSENIKDFINATSDIMLVIDDAGIITDANLPAEQFLGYKKEELFGKAIRTLYSEYEILDRDLSYVKGGGRVDGSYVNLIKKGGDLLPVSYSLRLMSDGYSYNYAILMKELQTKRALEDLESIARTQEGLAKNFRTVSDLKSQFIYNIAHELKTPLTNIKGFAKLMYDGEFGQLNDEQKEYLKTILDESERLMLIITQVLDAAKLDANKVKLDLKEVDLKELYNNPSVKALEESARNKGLAFEWNVAYDTPLITADPNRLIQVFVNLIGNAIKFTENGGITVKISKSSKRSVMCEVIDTGIGISDDDKRKIFKKFYQASKKGLVKQDGSGTGLGLAITKEIVDLHKGKIRFDSVLGKGSRFWFTLPINQSQRQKKRE